MAAHRCLGIFLALASCVNAAYSYSSFRLASIFSENMVLQRAPAAANVWGWTSPSSLVTAKLNCSAAGGSVWAGNVTPNADGLWVATLPPQNASHGACYASFADGNSLAEVWFLNVKFGEVLLCQVRFFFPLRNHVGPAAL